MYYAELRGKLSARAKDSEDILTSNVFSFFKYADRAIYLKALLGLINVDASTIDLDRAKLEFWHNYDDGTEPDLVLQVGKYYLLFEMKLNSEVGFEEENPAGQLIREIKAGSLEAERQNQKFKLIFVSADALCPEYVLINIPPELRRDVKWINWQSITSSSPSPFVETPQPQTPDLEFAHDLYDLLDHKHLRGFISFARLKGNYTYQTPEKLFFAVETSKYRGVFMGFDKSLSAVSKVQKAPAPVFYGSRRFNGLPDVAIFDRKSIFYEKEKR